MILFFWFQFAQYVEGSCAHLKAVSIKPEMQAETGNKLWFVWRIVGMKAYVTLHNTSSD